MAKEPVYTKLDINTQKDEIIARLLLQRYYGLKLGSMYSKEEINHIKEFTTPEDQKFFSEAFQDISEL